jgi:hypothetical protein
MENQYIYMLILNPEPMKKLIPIFLLLSTQAKAQVPDYFANDPKWNVTSMCAFGGDPSCIENSTYVYDITGDTVFGLFTYKKIRYHGIHSYSWMAPPPNPGCGGTSSFNLYNYAYLRQDTNKIWQYNTGSSSDELLYDFDLNVGDTLPLTTINYCTNYTVTSIDTVVVDAVIHRRFHLNTGCGWSTELIEGLGHTHGFLEPMSVPLECGYTNQCFMQDSSTYTWPTGTCAFTVNIHDYIQTQKITIYPNPSNGKFNVECKNIKAITVYNSTGSIIINQKNITGNINNLQLNNKGIFLVKIDFINSSSQVERIIVE